MHEPYTALGDSEAQPIAAYNVIVTVKVTVSATDQPELHCLPVATVSPPPALPWRSPMLVGVGFRFFGGGISFCFFGGGSSLGMVGFVCVCLIGP